MPNLINGFENSILLLNTTFENIILISSKSFVSVAPFPDVNLNTSSNPKKFIISNCSFYNISSLNADALFLDSTIKYLDFLIETSNFNLISCKY